MYLERPYPTSYQELCEAYPRFYLEVLEMREILKVQGRRLDDLADGAEQMIANGFVQTADDAALALLEEERGITHTSAALTLEQRRAIIAAKLSGHRHIGAPEIRDVIAPLVDGDISIALYGGTISINITQEGESARAYQAAMQIIKPLIPAHLALALCIRLTHSSDLRMYYGVGVTTTRRVTVACNAPL